MIGNGSRMFIVTSFLFFRHYCQRGVAKPKKDGPGGDSGPSGSSSTLAAHVRITKQFLADEKIAL